MTISIDFDANDTDYIEKLDALVAAINAIGAGTAIFGVAVTLDYTSLTEKISSVNARVLSAAGEQTLPLQPAFLAINTVQDANQTGDGTNYTVICDSEIFDQNADYNNATGTFTAPVTGRYRIGGSVYYTGLTASHTSGSLTMVTSNRSIVGFGGNFAAMRNSADELVVSFSYLVDMDAGDTAMMTTVVSGGTKVADIDVTHTTFSAQLVA